MEQLLSLPNSVVFSAIGVVFYLALVGRRVQRVAYNIAEHLVETGGTGVSKGALGGLFKRITPGWAGFLVWTCSLISIAFMVYIGFRFGWIWAIVYAVADHVLKSVDLPIAPTVSACYKMVAKKAEKRASKAVSKAIRDYQPDYKHL